MAGVLIHILSGILLAGVILYRGYDREFAWAGFVGALFPDIFKYLLLGIYYGNLDFFYVINTSIWKGMEEITIWGMSLTFALVFAGIGFLLYEIHWVKDGKFWEVEEIDLFLLAGVLVHMIIDLVWIESGWLV